MTPESVAAASELLPTYGALVVNPKLKDYVLDRDGFEIYPKAFPFSSAMVDKLVKHAGRRELWKHSYIFNDADLLDAKNDKKRAQVPLCQFNDPDVDALHDLIDAKLLELFPHCRSSDTVLLRSLSGCKPQKARLIGIRTRPLSQ